MWKDRKIKASFIQRLAKRTSFLLKIAKKGKFRSKDCKKGQVSSKRSWKKWQVSSKRCKKNLVIARSGFFSVQKFIFLLQKFYFAVPNLSKWMWIMWMWYGVGKKKKNLSTRFLWRHHGRNINLKISWAKNLETTFKKVKHHSLQESTNQIFRNFIKS